MRPVAAIIACGIALAACVRLPASLPLPRNTDSGSIERLNRSGYEILYRFQNSPDGATPTAEVTYFKGLLYGTTSSGGASGRCGRCGTVYSMTANGVEQVLYSFPGRPNGAEPIAGLTVWNGALYGTTLYGGRGATRGCSGTPGGCGTVFKITRSGYESIVYAFKGGADGSNPSGGVLAFQGNLYGTTTGGSRALGTVFRLNAFGQEHVLHKFKGMPDDGAFPIANLVELEGNFYGVTSLGGAHNAGTVFKISPAGAEQILYSFDVAEGESPTGLVALNGRLYGTTSADGPHGRGTVFSITPAGDFRIVHSFRGFPKGDGAYPYAPPIAVDGILYGTTQGGGTHGNGTVYVLSPLGSESVLHSFGHHPDGIHPLAPLRFVNGVLYGTTANGGMRPFGHGTVFRINP
jgi:uncharacterized repeat protein (TIGR03803 family)